MVKDFGELKRIKQWIDDNRDHGYIHHSDDKRWQLLKDDWLKTFDLGTEPTAENMAQYLYQMIKPKETLLSSIELYETPTSSTICNG